MAAKKPPDMQRAFRIKRVREERLKVSQEALAEMISKAIGRSFSRGAVGNWEIGKDAGREGLRALADISNVDFNWLDAGRGIDPFSDNSDKGQIVVGQRDQFNEEERDLLRRRAALTPSQRAVFDSLLTVLHEASQPQAKRGG